MCYMSLFLSLWIYRWEHMWACLWRSEQLLQQEKAKQVIVVWCGFWAWYMYYELVWVYENILLQQVQREKMTQVSVVLMLILAWFYMSFLVKHCCSEMRYWSELDFIRTCSSKLYVRTYVCIYVRTYVCAYVLIMIPAWFYTNLLVRYCCSEMRKRCVSVVLV